MQRYLDDREQVDLAQKIVFLTGPHQVGKTTLSRQLIAQQGGQYLLECKLSEPKPHRALQRFAREQLQALATQVVRHLPHSHAMGDILMVRADEFLNGLAA